MARRKDEDKRLAILNQAKRRFAQQGFESTSMTELARAAGIPVGSLYTYFESKDQILATIVEEGWGEFSAALREGLTEAVEKAGVSEDEGARSLVELSYLVRTALPGLFGDLDFIAILLARAGRDSGLESKLDYLTDLIIDVVSRYDASRRRSSGFDRSYFRTALVVFLLGSLEAMRLIHHGGIALDGAALISFLSSTIEAALACSLPDLGDPAPDDRGKGSSRATMA